MANESFRMKWEQLLSDKRHSPDAKNEDEKQTIAPENQDTRTEFERDCDRVVFSAPFRRLAGKTQVHPFAEIDQIHNRLTHTLEVVSVGRSLATAAGRMIYKKGELPPGRSVEDLSFIVQAACLAHDIGNPPFGHAGEDVIREWAKDRSEELFGPKNDSRFRGIARDWLFFEGNAQSFRMVARADNRDQVYFRLTYASLGAMIKYPWCSNDERVDTNKKLSVFYSEREIFDDVVATLGLRKPNGGVIRHPLSFLSETADDICYRITDFEDAVEMRILHEQDVREIFAKIIGKDTKGPLSAMRAKAIGCFVEAAVKTFEKHYDSIMAGERDWSLALKSDFPPSMKEALHDIEEKYQYIFRHRPKVVVELGAYNILGKILGVYADAVKQLSKNHDYAKLGFIHRRCVDLAWGDVYVKVNQEQDYDWWLGRVMDFVSGMTDNYATKVAAEIQGV